MKPSAAGDWSDWKETGNAQPGACVDVLPRRRSAAMLKALISRVVVFVNDPSSVERRIDYAVFLIILWSYGRKICLNMCHGRSLSNDLIFDIWWAPGHGNSENSHGCSCLLRICFIYGKRVYRIVESLCKLFTANKLPFDLPTNECKSKYCPP